MKLLLSLIKDDRNSSFRINSQIISINRLEHRLYLSLLFRSEPYFFVFKRVMTQISHKLSSEKYTMIDHLLSKIK